MSDAHIFKLERNIKKLRKEIDIIQKEKDEAEFRRDVAEWAVIGIASNNVSVDIQQIESIEYAIDIGRAAGKQILYDSSLAFRDHAEMCEMRRHIHYLENHAASRGLSFAPFKIRNTQTLPENSMRPSWGYSYFGFKRSY